jgi:hypothetical protein
MQSIDAVELAERLAAWLRAAGMEDTGLAVDFSDVIAAARRAEQILSRLLELRPRDAECAGELFDDLCELQVWLFGEMKYHLGELERAWPLLEECLTPE